MSWQKPFQVLDYCIDRIAPQESPSLCSNIITCIVDAQPAEPIKSNQSVLYSIKGPQVYDCINAVSSEVKMQSSDDFVAFYQVCTGFLKQGGFPTRAQIQINVDFWNPDQCWCA